MKVVSDIRSPNFSDLTIPVDFVVLHYTAATLKRTLDLFTSPQTEVSAHLVVDTNGTVYEMVECLGGVAKRAWHAGKSRFECSRGGVRGMVEGFNDCSIGIELVNLNGNVFAYTEAQYAALFSLIESLKGRYPALNNPEAIIGHEQIAGFRGKADPGRCFEWERLFAVCYPGQGAPTRSRVCGEQLAERVRALVQGFGISQGSDGEVFIPAGLPEAFFSLLSSLLEVALAER
ncbi:MAG: N-acetylmuramoyl-L-alanine amidase [Pseudomonadota bacterium]|jgi:N-acetylmuramoyl-L-alanine amidase